MIGGSLNRTVGRVSLLVFALAVGGLITFGANQASASGVSCGDTITTDTELDSDLVDCPNNGIVIGADNVELDLNGHTVDGDGEVFEPCPKKEFCDVGVVSEGHNGVTIKGGRFKEFFVGVSVVVAKGAHLRELAATRNILGVGVFDSRGARLSRLTASHNVDSGILMVNAARSALIRSSANANGLDTDQAGLGIFESSRTLVSRNVVSGNGDIGINTEGSERTRIVHNKIAGNPEAGVLGGGDKTVIAKNRLVRNGDGIAWGGNDNVIRRNRVTKSKGCDGAYACGLGISFEAGKRNVIVGNSIRHARRVGLRVAGYGPISGIVVANNHVTDAGKDGIAVESVRKPVSNVELRGNRVAGSGTDGIDVAVSSTTITGNNALRNGALGIEAIAGVTDGGGNHASGNGDSRQCVNVMCQ